MENKVVELIRDCSTCKWADEYFGDCCHPKGKGCHDMKPSLDNCLDKDHAWWERYVKPGENNAGML